MKILVQRFGMAIAYAVFLFVLSSIPELSFPVRVWNWDDKIHHVLAYAPLGGLLLKSIVWKRSASKSDLWLAILIGSLYGVSDEIHQYFVPGRFMDWTDAVADASGVVLGGWIFYRWRERRQKNNAKIPGKKFSQSKPNYY